MEFHYVFCILLLIKFVHGEVYTAVVEMEELLKTQRALLHTLQNYVQEQENRINLLKRHANNYANEYEKASVNPSEYLSNPINAYLLVKRLTSDWKLTETLMKNNDVYEEAISNLTNNSSNIKFPTDEDLTGAALALLRLQDTYKLDTHSVAEGKLNGINYTTRLSVSDCFELGRQSYNNKDFYHTVLWMDEALKRHQVENTNTTSQDIKKWEILEYLAYSTYMQGNVTEALDLTEELLNLNPGHERAQGNRLYYKSEIANDNKIQKKGDDGEVLEEPKQSTERVKYEELCRGDAELPVKIRSKLKCRYTHKNNPYLKLAPLKEEEAYLKPWIALYREALYDSEIETIKKLAQPRLQRATVQNYKTGELEHANYRISKSAWLKESEDKVIKTVSERVEHMTGLTVETAEELQVVNYGVGGHYEPHFDFARREEVNAFKSLGTGNRIATVLFYMSTVEQGGATVFPELNLALRPEKGTAAVWFNLHTSGSGDYRTRHAACPVLKGSKWVCNKWLHEKGQEFLRPCNPKDSHNETSDI